MTVTRRADAAARALVTLGALLPYWRLLTFSTIFVTDDGFASDVFNGELPGRVLISQMLRRGELPVWTSQLCSGMPLAGAPADPIGLGLFTFLPTAVALDAFVIVLLLIAAHGAYALARRFGSDRFGAVLAGVAFAGSGYIAAQLKHLGIISTVVWLPFALLMLDRALAAPDEPPTHPRMLTLPRRALWLAGFAAIFAEQVLCGFPQSAYIGGLVYACFAIFRLASSARRGLPIRDALALLAGVGAAAAVAAAIGGVVMLPLFAAGSVSDRAEALGWDWSTRLAYWPPNVLTFLRPYVFGFVGNGTYSGDSIYWEDYGYVGLLPFLLAWYGAAAGRRTPIVIFTLALTILAYFCVLGRATPVFHVIYLVIPGMKMFRFPSRFLIVVELGLALLAAIGLTELRATVARRYRKNAAFAVALGVCIVTIADLFVYQPRQNPMVNASDWLATPSIVGTLERDTPSPRTFTPRHRDVHRLAFAEARGWEDVTPFHRLRDVLDPNTGGGYWNIPSADCYAAIAPRWYVDLWGDHNRELSLMAFLTGIDPNRRTVKVAPVLPNVLRGFGVTHVLSQHPLEGVSLPLVSQTADAYAYRIDGASRVRVVSGVHYAPTDNDAVRRLVDPTFNPDGEVILDDVPADHAQARPGAAAGRATIAEEDARHLTVDADVSDDGYLVVADTFFPGWSAEIDGRAAPIYRANLSIRAVPIARGHHRVRFEYEMPGLVRGAQATLAGLSALLLWAAGARYADARVRR